MTKRIQTDSSRSNKDSPAGPVPASAENSMFPRLTRNRAANLALTLAMVAVICFLGWNALNSVSGSPIGWDSGAFTTVACHLLSGKTMCKDVIMSQPAMAILLNMAAIGIGGRTISSVRTMERLFAMAGGLLFFLILSKGLKSRALAFLGTLLYFPHFFDRLVLEGGNLMEEYAVIFVLAGILCVLHAREAGGRKALVQSCAAGLMFSLAAFTKDPFILSSVPWFIYLILSPGWNRKSMLARAGCFIAAAFAPLVVFVLYLLLKGALLNWLDNYYVGFAYVGDKYQQHVPLMDRLRSDFAATKMRVFDRSGIGPFLFCAGVAVCLVPGFVKKYAFFPVAAIGAFVMDYWATTLSGKHFGHYYMQLVPSYVMIAISGIAFLSYLGDKWRIPDSALLTAALLAILFCWDRSAWFPFIECVRGPSPKPAVGPITSYIVQNSVPSDPLWVGPGYTTRFYFETGRLSPATQFVPTLPWFVDTPLSTREEKISTLKSQL
ncbi:MAG: hypothetical protein V2A74_06885, partial [bacterium]